MFRHLHAAYVLTGIRDALYAEEPSDGLCWPDVLRFLSSFTVDDDLGQDQTDDPRVRLLINIVSRGLPTLPSLYIEREISEATDCAAEDSDGGGIIRWTLTEHGWHLMPLVKRALAIVDPRVVPEQPIAPPEGEPHAAPESPAEEAFFHRVLPDIGGRHVTQFFRPQRSIRSLFASREIEFTSWNREPGPELKRQRQNCQQFINQRVDFCAELPRAEGCIRGLVVEVDGPEHDAEPQRNLDALRDGAILAACGMRTFRITHHDNAEILHALADSLEHPWLRMAGRNCAEPLYATPSGLSALTAALSPIAIARVQRCILEALRRGVLSLGDPEWRIAVLERDVACARWALDDLRQLLEALMALAGDASALPRIVLFVRRTPEFSGGAAEAWIDVATGGAHAEMVDVDLLLDVSVLLRTGLCASGGTPQLGVRARHTMIARSAHAPDVPRTIMSGERMPYRPQEAEARPALTYFLRNLFRKSDFRPGQLEILFRTLGGNPVIALLPTGAGKSLAYQLSALLQPGITIVVDPLKSLMRDQEQNLREAGIDTVTHISSAIADPGERQRRCLRMARGWYQFVFVSPERFQIAEFRRELLSMRNRNALVSFCVVDEAHCVSEWGHDFRTSYLRLGTNARRYCPAAVPEVPMIALTGTASFDVLADVQRELGITDGEAVIAPSQYNRDELCFRLRNVVVGDDDPMRRPGDLAAVAMAKQEALSEVLHEVAGEHGLGARPADFFATDPDYPNCAIIFCPHVGWVFGVNEVRDRLVQDIPALRDLSGVFAGGGGGADMNENQREQIQDRFKRDDITLLVATKAFGMGIDKPNVRLTVHFTMPQSPEAFYQEAGRAGRDRSKAFCYILYGGMPHPTSPGTSVDREFQHAFHRRSFRGQRKEKRVLHELLTAIRFPSRTMSDRLRDDVLDHTGLLVRFIPWVRPGMNRLYINGLRRPQCYGFIDGNTLEHQDTPVDVDAANAQGVVRIVAETIRATAAPGTEWRAFLQQAEFGAATPGIERVLARMNEGERRPIVIPFCNDMARQIVAILHEADGRWDEAMVKAAYRYSREPADFIEALMREFRRRHNGEAPVIEQEAIATAGRLFLRIREEDDTSKAVYRLAVLGVIEDYEVDYRAQAIIALVVHRTCVDTIGQLRQYLSRYLAPIEVGRRLDALERTRGQTSIQKCLSALISFVYENVARRREEAIDVMERAIRDGLQDEARFSERINTYFDSRLTPELRKFQRDYSFGDLLEFLQKSEGTPDTVSHLRGACDRLLTENPENGMLLILRAVAAAILGRTGLRDAIGDFARGWSDFIQRERWTWGERTGNLTRLSAAVTDFDPVAGAALRGFLLREHALWIQWYLSEQWETK